MGKGGKSKPTAKKKRWDNSPSSSSYTYGSFQTEAERFREKAEVLKEKALYHFGMGSYDEAKRLQEEAFQFESRARRVISVWEV